jgi:hypothetical protein
VLVELDGLPPLVSGMRVDVFFKADAKADRGVAAPTGRMNF